VEWQCKIWDPDSGWYISVASCEHCLRFCQRSVHLSYQSGEFSFIWSNSNDACACSLNRGINRLTYGIKPKKLRVCATILYQCVYTMPDGGLRDIGCFWILYFRNCNQVCGRIPFCKGCDLLKSCRMPSPLTKCPK
jgi:hypothetical protein